MTEQLFTTDDISKMLQVSKSTIKRWTEEGKLSCFRTPGGHRKFKQSSIQEFISRYHYEIEDTQIQYSDKVPSFSPKKGMQQIELMVEQ